jgi:Uma2 family endonuclease
MALPLPISADRFCPGQPRTQPSRAPPAALIVTRDSQGKHTSSLIVQRNYSWPADLDVLGNSDKLEFMSIATPTVFSPQTLRLPQPKRWTVGEFHTIVSEPCFENRRMILVEGEILDMPNPNPPHDVSILLAEAALRAIFGSGHCIRIQMALVLGASTDPMPDIAVVVGSPRDYSKSHPRTAVLVVEVSESTLAYDSGDKANLYAASGIQEYWVIDLVHRELIIFRDPITDAAQVFGARYRSKINHNSAGSVSPLASASAQVRVADLLP